MGLIHCWHLLAAVSLHEVDVKAVSPPFAWGMTPAHRRQLCPCACFDTWCRLVRVLCTGQ